MRVSTLVLALCCLGACSTPSQIDAPGYLNRCARSEDCPQEAECELESGLCTRAAPVEPYPFELEITIPADRRTGQEALTVTTSTTFSSEIDISIRRPTSIFGELRAGGTMRITADVVFRSVSSGGLSITPNVQTVRSRENTELDEFTASVIPGIYDVQIWPRGNSASLIAPVLVENELFRDSRRFEPYIPTPDAHQERFSLALYYLASTDVERDARAAVPADDLEVQVFRGERLISSTARSDPEQPGRYRLAISGLPEDGSTPVTFRISAADPLNAYPTFSLDRQFVPRPDVDELGDGERVAAIYVPKLDESWPCFTAQVVNPAREGVPGAIVRLATERGIDPVTGWRGPLRVEQTSSADRFESACGRGSLGTGSFELRLLEGTYDVLISAPNYAISEETITVTASGQAGLLFVVQERATVEGSALSWNGTPLRGALVEGVRSSGSVGDSRTTEARYSSTSVGDDGSFVLPLDVGSYEIAIVPPPDSDLPWTVFNRTVQGPSYRIDVGERIATAPVVVRRRVVYVDGAGIDGAKIVAWATPQGRERIRIGRTFADQNGEFTLLLPSSLRDASR